MGRTVLLLCLLLLIAPGVPAPDIAESPLPESESAGCAVTLVGDYEPAGGGPVLTVVIKESQVRVRGAWWASLEPTCSENEVVLRPGESDRLHVACNLRLGCEKRRRYRVFLKRGSTQTGWAFYPGRTSWTKDTRIDLGNLAEAFE